MIHSLDGIDVAGVGIIRAAEVHERHPQIRLGAVDLDHRAQAEVLVVGQMRVVVILACPRWLYQSL
jgi:hypothetical protein